MHTTNTPHQATPGTPPRPPRPQKKHSRPADPTKGQSTAAHDSPEPSCLICGCTEGSGCHPSCSWIVSYDGMTEYEVCSKCVPALVGAVIAEFNSDDEISRITTADLLNIARGRRGNFAEILK